MQKQTGAVSKSQAGAGDFPYEVSNFCSFAQSSIFVLFQAEENNKDLS